MEVCDDFALKICPRSPGTSRLFVVNVLPPSSLKKHSDVIAAVAPPPLTSFTTSPSADLPSASSSSRHPRDIAFLYNDVYPKNISMLPNEVMLMIFSHLSSDDLENVSKVCTHWSSLTQHACVCTRMRFWGSDGVSTSEACRKLASAEKLVELYLDSRVDVVPLLEQASKSGRKLRRLTINDVGSSNGQSILNALGSLMIISDLEELTMSFCSTEGILGTFFSCLRGRLANIRKLNLKFVSDLRHNHLVKIVYCCPLLAELRLFTLSLDSHALIFDDNDMALIHMLSGTLEVLKIEAAKVTDLGLRHLTACNRLRVICLRELTQVTDDGIQALLFFPDLQNLCLIGAINVSSIGWTLLFMLRKWPNLRKLALIKCRVSDQAAAFLIPNYPELRELNIIGCTELSMDIIRYLLTNLKRLQLIKLCLSQIDGCVYWIPACAPGISKIVYHSCGYPNSPHIEMYEPYEKHRRFSFNAPERSIIVSLDDESDFEEMN